ncbi:PD-(D/E)XK nuclease family protein [bacterium]|nr:PD-(D/E)XK nuclease family protein [bacterium]
MVNFNLSYSSYTLYLKSPIEFFYQYILHEKHTDKCIEVYGKAGTIVHTILEKAVKGVLTIQNFQKEFNKLWIKENLPALPDFTGRPLDIISFKNICIHGIKIINIYKSLGYSFITEEQIAVELDNIPVKGYIDVVVKKGDSTIIMDWKTNGKYESGKYKDQQLFYAYLYYRKYKILPNKLVWCFLKLKRQEEVSFTKNQIIKFEQELKRVIDEIKLKGIDINNYELGDWDTAFNKYKTLCREQEVKRQGGQTITLMLEKAKIYISNSNSDLDKKISEEFSYELKNSFFIKRAMGKKGVKFDGKKYFYLSKTNTLPIGFLNRLVGFLADEKYTIKIVDKRMKLREYDFLSKLNGIDLRDYQEEAVNHIIDKQITFLELATSGGKTAISAEVIRRNKKLTLYIVDRDVLLSQTKKELENFLQMEVGIIKEGKMNLKVVNIAMIQTLYSLLKKGDNALKIFLANVGTLIIDEGHTCAAKSFSEIGKWVWNADIRLGMSGTYEREDGNTMIIESVVGYNELKISAEKLIELDYIMKPIIQFYHYPCLSIIDNNYAEAYKMGVVNNRVRNKLITDLTNSFESNTTILLMVSQLQHGEILEEMIDDAVFIRGDIESNIRDKWIKELKQNKRKVVIGTSSIIQKGLNVPNLNCIINATGNLSSITTIQSLGRVLRKNKNKKEAMYIDFIDKGKYMQAHTKYRMEILKNQGHEIKMVDIND